jgi:hypothetical protein
VTEKYVDPLRVASRQRRVEWRKGIPTRSRAPEERFHDAWGFNAHGFLAGGAVPASAMGRTTYDGDGTCFSEAKLNAGGTVLTLTSISCTYTVNPDGTGVQQTTFTAGAFTTDFVLVEHAKEFLFIVSDTAQPGNTIASGVARRQR